MQGTAEMTEYRDEIAAGNSWPLIAADALLAVVTELGWYAADAQPIRKGQQAQSRPGLKACLTLP
jgi:hypothetical protein